MRKIPAALVCALLLCLAVWRAGLADIPDLRISESTLADLNQLKEDIAAERKLHHTLDDSMKEEVKKAAEKRIESYLAEYTGAVMFDWAWYDREYEYTRDKDYFTFKTHVIHDRRAVKTTTRAEVMAEMLWNGTDYELFRLYVNGQFRLREADFPPKNHLIDYSNVVINKKTGVNISELTPDEMDGVEEQIKREIEANHNPRSSREVNSILQKTVNELYAEKGISVSWPGGRTSVICDWDCYEVTARITCEQNGERTENIPVTAVLFPEGNTWRVCYLAVGDEVLADTRDRAESEKEILFLNSRKYQEALTMMLCGRYEEAAGLFETLGGYQNSAAMAEECGERNRKNRYRTASCYLEEGKYKEAAGIFDALEDWTDSREKAEESWDKLYEDIYLQAVRDRERGAYGKALEGFAEIPGYRDSDSKAEEIREMYREQDYNQALGLEDRGRYTEAMELYEKLAGYRDSDMRREACGDKLNGMAYTEAEKLLENGEYERAAEQFELLGDYLDSAARAEKSRGILASINREILFPETNLIIIKGRKMTLEPQVSRLSDSAPETTRLKYSAETKSGNGEVIRVDQNGTVTAVNTGRAVIRCEAADNAVIRAEISVQVVKNVSGVTVYPSRLELKIPLNGDEETGLWAATDPVDAYIRTGTWTSGNETVATVDQEGNVTPLKAGRAVITFTSDDTTRGTKEARCVVTVTQRVTSVELEETSGTVYPGKTVQLKAAALPKDAENRKLTWSSADESVATVNQKGLVKALREGETLITVSSPDGPEVQYTLKVIPKQ